MGLRDQFKKIHEKVDELEIVISDNVAGPQYIPSPWGLIPVPKSMTQGYTKIYGRVEIGLKQGLDWDHPFFAYFKAQRKAEERDKAEGKVVEVKEIAVDSLTGERIEPEFDDSDTFDEELAAGREERIARVLEKLEIEQPKPEPLLPVPPSQSRNGWIAPDGLYYPCEYSGHIRAAMRLAKEEYQLDDLGWVKVSDATDPESWDHNRPSIFSKKDPTQAQLNTILDLCTAHGYKYDFDAKAGLGSDYFEDRL